MSFPVSFLYSVETRLPSLSQLPKRPSCRSRCLLREMSSTKRTNRTTLTTTNPQHRRRRRWQLGIPTPIHRRAHVTATKHHTSPPPSELFGACLLPTLDKSPLTLVLSAAKSHELSRSNVRTAVAALCVYPSRADSLHSLSGTCLSLSSASTVLAKPPLLEKFHSNSENTHQQKAPPKKKFVRKGKKKSEKTLPDNLY